MHSTQTAVHVNGIAIHFERTGAGEPIVLVHGSWDTAATWALLVDELVGSFEVVTYDRRGHGRSGDGPHTRRDDEDDLAALVEALGIAPVHLVGNSFGGSIALSVAARRPDLVRTVSIHEPPLLEFAAGDPAVRWGIAELNAVADLVEAGRPEQAARDFVERLALGPGAWAMMPPEVRELMVRHAGTFAGELRDPGFGRADLDGLERPALLTVGDSSPEWFATFVEPLRRAIPGAATATIAGAGHIPQETHPREYAGVLARFAEGAG
jgi:pimeloyl-ACP methyl ester carboxylesterase